jgi:hypothetical protein
MLSGSQARHSPIEVDADGGRLRRDGLSGWIARRIEASPERTKARSRAESKSWIAKDIDMVGPAIDAHGRPQNDCLLVDLLGVSFGRPWTIPGGLVQGDGSGSTANAGRSAPRCLDRYGTKGGLAAASTAGRCTASI